MGFARADKSVYEMAWKLEALTQASRLQTAERMLDSANTLLERSAERLGEIVLSRAMNLAAMEARADRIDRTQAEARAIIDGLVA